MSNFGFIEWFILVVCVDKMNGNIGWFDMIM